MQYAVLLKGDLATYGRDQKVCKASQAIRDTSVVSHSQVHGHKVSKSMVTNQLSCKHVGIHITLIGRPA